MKLEKIKEFKKFASEVILKVLMKMDKDYQNYQNLDDYDGMQKVKLEFIPKYEKLYLEFSNDISENLDEMDDKKIESLMGIVNDIMKVHNINIDYILDEMEKRENLKGKSGAEAVEKLFKYQIKELELKMERLLEQANTILDNEARLEAELRDAIQEDDQMGILDQLTAVRSRWSTLEKKTIQCKTALDGLKESLVKKWTYDIYGTISQEELKKVFSSEMKNK
ncbi:MULTISPECIES: hypothetical protein [Psychrilyobacter]|uniref:Uncharacterized protein n=1 Tax=Psychrilyobacter piezotolerans TaxID=2293438 RepID=A0ABX9KDX8_9FUSO|nr:MULTISPECIES: hypothetical protein [Psychrilyobacter]MCS5422748.1 hypothetical protein [Psychrilyobacter sp. S5]NDI79227.1 hypothetical protein [Psychrilyobacter piezotolerans]RDE58841.1 hypothetical protein DV867_15190 [Psychrilyobacter sp. S5]REI39339.1 hypothetical protein DYH56_15190 [Psychrilyobacter piezotolerans]